MIIKFRSDASVQTRGFSAHWRAGRGLYVFHLKIVWAIRSIKHWKCFSPILLWRPTHCPSVRSNPHFARVSAKLPERSGMRMDHRNQQRTAHFFDCESFLSFSISDLELFILPTCSMCERFLKLINIQERITFLLFWVAFEIYDFPDRRILDGSWWLFMDLRRSFASLSSFGQVNKTFLKMHSPSLDSPTTRPSMKWSFRRRAVSISTCRQIRPETSRDSPFRISEASIFLFFLCYCWNY